MSEALGVHGIYRHYKTGGYYAVLGLARNTTNGPHEGSKLVVYYSLKTHQVFARDIVQFNEKVKSTDGKMVLRFEPVTEASI